MAWSNASLAGDCEIFDLHTFWDALPFVFKTIPLVTSIIIATFVIIGLLGSLQMYTLQRLVANVGVVIPANIILVVAYFVLTPLRWIYCRFMNMVMTTIISIFNIKPTFWDATYTKLLQAFPFGYKAVLGVNVMQLSEDETRQIIRKRMTKFPFPCLQKTFGRFCCSPSLMNSFTMRLLTAVTIFPLLSWWLIGFVYVPFVKAPQHCDNRDSRNDCEGSIKEENAQEDEEAHPEGASPVKVVPVPKRVCGAPGPATVDLNIPSCVFLKRARNFYGTEKGNVACLNE